MKNRDNEILIIQTSDCSAIFITKDFFPHDDMDDEELCYSIHEGNNPLYWSNKWHNELSEVINLLEFPNAKISGYRDYISWWLNGKPLYVDESIKGELKRRLELYHLTGEIRNAFRNANLGLEFNPDCLIEWHEILNVEYDQELLQLILKRNVAWDQKQNIVNIQFEGFELLPYKSISLKINSFYNFQMLLNYIYGFINKEVSKFSYQKEWLLYNTKNGLIIEKEDSSDTRTLNNVGINNYDKIICYMI
jgi:hypothetical protein